MSKYILDEKKHINVIHTHINIVLILNAENVSENMWTNTELGVVDDVFFVEISVNKNL